jgi:hypothetical protein
MGGRGGLQTLLSGLGAANDARGGRERRCRDQRTAFQPHQQQCTDVSPPEGAHITVMIVDQGSVTTMVQVPATPTSTPPSKNSKASRSPPFLSGCAQGRLIAALLTVEHASSLAGGGLHTVHR